MAIAVISEVSEGTLDMYDTVNEKLEAGGGIPAPGHVFHCVGAMEGGGFRVFDVWESEDAFNDFRNNRLGPAIVEVTGQEGGEPDRTVYELHNFRQA